jgi:hypothetical protein
LLESTSGVAEPVSENYELDFGGEEDEEDEEGGRADEEEEEEEEEEVTHKHDGQTFEEALITDIDLIVDFAAGLKHQVQFRDQRLLNVLEREGTGFLRFAKACIEKEKRMNSTRSPRLPTWDKSTSSAMFAAQGPQMPIEAHEACHFCRVFPTSRSSILK